jgi:hypothetical protein
MRRGRQPDRAGADHRDVMGIRVVHRQRSWGSKNFDAMRGP